MIAVALLGRPRGNRGELTAISLSSSPERFADLTTVMLAENEYQVENVWWHQDTLVFKFKGVDSISDAEKLTGCEVQIPEAQRIQIGFGSYFHSDLIGCTVRDRATARDIGLVAGLQDAGGPGLLELDDGTLIPFARDICVFIDIAKQEILVDLPEGLLELNKP